MRGLALLLLVPALAGCNRHGTADVTLDAAAAQRNATEAKTVDDLAAADAASRGPAPVVRDAAPTPSPAAAPRLPAARTEDASEDMSAAGADEDAGDQNQD